MLYLKEDDFKIYTPKKVKEILKDQSCDGLFTFIISCHNVKNAELDHIYKNSNKILHNIVTLGKIIR
jgi:hypothetical protein